MLGLTGTHMQLISNDLFKKYICQCGRTEFAMGSENDVLREFHFWMVEIAVKPHLIRIDWFQNLAQFKQNLKNSGQLRQF